MSFRISLSQFSTPQPAAPGGTGFPRGLLPALMIGLVAGAAVLGYRLADASAPYDDAFITFRYARNFAMARGFVYNLGSDPLGTTSPAYGLLLGILQKVFGGDPVFFANWTSALALALAAWFGFRFVLADYGLVAGGVAGLSIALNPMLLSSWGGEWLAAVPLLAAGFYYYRVDRLVPTAIVFSLAIILRPEAALAAVPVAIDAWVRRKPGVERASVVTVGIGLGWALVAWLVIGGVVPSTFGTKLAHAQSGVFDTLLGGFSQSLQRFARADTRMLAIAVLAWHGALLAVVQHSTWRLILLWSFAHLFFYTALRLPFYHWYLVPLAFVISLACGPGMVASVGYLRTLVGSRPAARFATSVVALALAGLGLAAELQSSVNWIRSKPDPREQMYNRIGGWLADNTPADASVAYLEIGRIGYFSDRRIVDLMGLVTPGVAEHVANQNFLWALYAHQPDYYLVNSSFGWAGSPVGESWFAGAYDRVTAFTAPNFDSEIALYRKRPGAVFPAPVIIEAAQVRNNAVVGELLPGTSHGQTFRAREDRLSGVATILATYDRANRGPMRFRLERLEPLRTIAEQRFDMADVKNNEWREFRFDAIADSAGRSFRFSIEADDATRGNAITIWYSTADRYDAGERLLNGAPAGGDLTLKLFYEPASP